MKWTKTIYGWIPGEKKNFEWHLTSALQWLFGQIWACGHMDIWAYGHMGIWAYAKKIWSNGVSPKKASKMELRDVDLRSVGPSVQKLWPTTFFAKKMTCILHYNAKKISNTISSQVSGHQRFQLDVQEKVKSIGLCLKILKNRSLSRGAG